MTHQISSQDVDFRAQFESCRSDPIAFGHREQLRLSYVYLTEHDVEPNLSPIPQYRG